MLLCKTLIAYRVIGCEIVSIYLSLSNLLYFVYHGCLVEHKPSCNHNQQSLILEEVIGVLISSTLCIELSKISLK